MIGMYNALSGMLDSAKKLQNSANNLVSQGRKKVADGDNLEIRPGINLTEDKNVNISNEMVNQIIAKSEFKANVKVIKIVDENIGTILDIKSWIKQMCVLEARPVELSRNSRTIFSFLKRIGVGAVS